MSTILRVSPDCGDGKEVVVDVMGVAYLDDEGKDVFPVDTTIVPNGGNFDILITDIPQTITVYEQNKE